MTNPSASRRLSLFGCRKFGAALVLVLVAVLNAGCKSAQSRSGTLGQSADRDTDAAIKLTAAANELMVSDAHEAEVLLQEALEADLFHGPAHNNLGVLYLQQDRLYEAAHEFEWARKLMPGHPDPRMNLALTLERAGRIDEAILTYKAGLEVYTEHIPTIQALCRAQVRHRRVDSMTEDHLEMIALEGDSAEWRLWAREQMVKLEATR
ncbi:MAG: tetratricopeptide repeat protein [Planctomycetota bacterium]